MNHLKNLIYNLKSFYYRARVKKKIHISLNKPIISFSFDDVPYTALKNGVPILDKHDVKATFYIAMGLNSNNNEEDFDEKLNERFLSNTEIQLLDKNGHDIACHTYSHYMLNSGNANEMVMDSKKNVQSLQNILQGKKIKHFSYPYGQVSFKAKRLLSNYYKTMRSTRAGINSGNADLNFLLAVSIYSHNFDKEKIISLINQAVEKGGWLIFYTHSVNSTPNNYSCTPEQLDWVISQAANSGANLFSIAKAYDVIKNQC